MTLFTAATVLQKVHQDNTSCWLCDQKGEMKRSGDRRHHDVSTDLPVKIHRQLDLNFL